MSRFLRGLWAIVLEARADNVTAEAARVAYYFFLSLWPFLLGLFAFTGIFGGEPAFEWIMGWVRRMLPPTPVGLLERYVRTITLEERPDMLSLGILLTLWSGSAIFASLTEGLNRMYDVEENRGWWKRRGLAMALLLLGSVLMTGGAAAILAGAELAARLGMDRATALLRYPLAFLALTVFLWLVYWALPAREPRPAKRHIAAGALVGAMLWVVATALFQAYVANFGDYQAYGIVGAMMVLMLWLYLTALAILFGGEVAVSLEEGVRERHNAREASRASST